MYRSSSIQTFRKTYRPCGSIHWSSISTLKRDEKRIATPIDLDVPIAWIWIGYFGGLKTGRWAFFKCVSWGNIISAWYTAFLMVTKAGQNHLSSCQEHYVVMKTHMIQAELHVFKPVDLLRQIKMAAKGWPLREWSQMVISTDGLNLKGRQWTS